jgi:glycosyltransferase involved in cell wall biosynthesis
MAGPKSRATISATVITLNEERNIRACLDNLGWCDEVVVVDSVSSDQTVALARQQGARVLTRPFAGYADQKNFALAQATMDWILSVDADERVTPELAAEIMAALANPGDVVGFFLPRRNHVFGRWINHGEWWPQYLLRLIRRGQGQWQGAVHEVLLADGPVRHLRTPLLHYPNLNLSAYLARIDRYTTMEAQAWYAAGLRPSLWKMLLYPPGLFAYEYIWRRGALDGIYGLVLAILMAYYTFLKRAKLWELALHKESLPPP